MSIIVKPFSLIVFVGAGSPADEPAFWRALGPGTIADARGIGFGFEFWAWHGEEHSAWRSGNFASDLRRCEIATQPFVFRSEQLPLAFSSSPCFEI